MSQTETPDSIGRPPLGVATTLRQRIGGGARTDRHPVMDATRRSILSFAAGILVTVVARSWAVVSLPHEGVVLYAGVLVGAILWVLGAYSGYVAVRSADRNG